MEQEKEEIRIKISSLDQWLNSRLPDWDMEEHEPAFDIDSMRELNEWSKQSEQNRILSEVNAIDTTKIDSTMALKLAIIKIIRGEKF